jgi:hypothetical protein
MNWYATDIPSLKYGLATHNLDSLKSDWQPYIDQLNTRKEKWKKGIKDCLSLLGYLKKYIYK